MHEKNESLKIVLMVVVAWFLWLLLKPHLAKESQSGFANNMGSSDKNSLIRQGQRVMSCCRAERFSCAISNTNTGFQFGPVFGNSTK